MSTRQTYPLLEPLIKESINTMERLQVVIDDHWKHSQNLSTVYTVKFRSTCRLFQIAYEGNFWSLCIVTLWQKVDFLISNYMVSWKGPLFRVLYLWYRKSLTFPLYCTFLHIRLAVSTLLLHNLYKKRPKKSVEQGTPLLQKIFFYHSNHSK